ncbi:MAG: NADH-dependent flavin oxidoreductase, partial [Streptococcus sp.]|nr:NADH-dependent flavin oxidoreductase [Streptococcus sp.]
ISSAQRLLIQTFFSTFSNERTDEYGCKTLEDRSRIGMEVLLAVQEVIDEYASDDFILGFRATPEETRGNQIGYTVDEFLEFFEDALKKVNIDYLAIASWGHDVFRNKVRAKGPHQGELVNKVVYDRLKGRVAVIASGGINSKEKALEALENADLVGLSTPFITDPEFAVKIQEGNESEIQLTIKPEALEALAIPKAAFKDIVPLMDFGESLEKEARDFFRGLEANYEGRETDEN